MSMFLFLLFFGDFTYTAPPGRWLDYARSRALSENRILIVEHTGPKGDYLANGGGQQKIFDGQGSFLYEIPVAKNAWMLICGVNQDQDTYLYQKHDEQSFHIWNPNFGDRVFTVVGKQPSSVGTLSRFAMVNNGQRLVFISKKSKPDPEGYLDDGYQVELVELKEEPIQHLFDQEDLPINLYLDTAIKVDNYDLFDHRVALSNIMSKTIWLLDLETMGTDGQMVEVHTTYTPMFFVLEHDFISYMGRYRGEWARCFQKIGVAQPLFVLTEADKEKPGYNELLDFWADAGRGSVFLENGILYYQKKDRLVAYDTVNNLLHHYSAPMTTENIGNVNGDREVTCDTATFRVRKKVSALSQYKTSRPAAVFQLQVNTFKKPL